MKPIFLWFIMCVVGLTTPVFSVPMNPYGTFRTGSPTDRHDKNGIQIKVGNMVIVEGGEDSAYDGRAGTVRFVGDHGIKVHFRVKGEDVLMQNSQHLTVVARSLGRWEPKNHERAMYTAREPANLADKVETITQSATNPGQLKWGGRDIDQSLLDHLVLLKDKKP